MIHQFVHKKPVVGNHDKATAEFGQVFLQYVQGYNIKIVGRFIEDQEVRIAHQHRHQVKTAPFAAAEFFDIHILHFRSK